MRLQNYGRLVKVEHYPEPSRSSRVLIKSSDVEVTRQVLRSIERSDTKENIDLANEKNKATISTSRNRMLTTESEEIEEERKNATSIESYSFNARNCVQRSRQRDSVQQTYGSLDGEESGESQQYENREKGYSRVEYKMRVDSLARQYELKVRKQKELHELELWKMREEIDELRRTMDKIKHKEKERNIERQKAAVPKPQAKQEYCHLCSNGEMINSLARINKELEETHSHCIRNQNECGMKILQLEQECLRHRERLEEANKEKMSANERIYGLEKLNKSLVEEVRQIELKIKSNHDDLLRQRERQQSKEKEARKCQEEGRQIQTQQKPKERLERLSFNDIAVHRPLNNSLARHSTTLNTTNSKSIGNIGSMTNQYRREKASYMSAMKKQTEAESLVERVKSLSTLNYRPVVERKERRYY